MLRMSDYNPKVICKMWYDGFGGKFSKHLFLGMHFPKLANVTTLALGSRPRQGVARLGAKRETHESLHMLPGVQRVCGNEPSHSQVNFDVGSWNPERTLESS
jgi:hypothetical protein